MNINTIKDVLFIGDILDNPRAYSGTKHVLYKNKLKIDYNKKLPKGFVNKPLSIVYFICVDDTIYKIGQTSGKHGIKGCMNFYCCAGQDATGANRFTINALIRQEMSNGKKVSVYMKWEEPVLMKIEGINRTHKIYAPVCAKSLEQVHLADYRVMTGTIPPWNFQESVTKVPSFINEQFATYRKMRAAARV